MQHNDDKLATLGSATINDGILVFYLANGATSQNITDAGYEFLLARGVSPGSKNDMWYSFLTNIASLSMAGTVPELKANWWANGAPLT